MPILSIVKSMVLQGLDGILVNVETDISSGMPCWDVVGLPDTNIKESKERVRTAIKNCGIDLLSRKYIINLSPASVRKTGSGLDLAIAIGILSSMKIVDRENLDNTIFIGELSLNGGLNKINGILPICIEAVKYGIKEIILPKENAKEAGIVKGLKVIGANNLMEVINHLNKKCCISPEVVDINELLKYTQTNTIDFSEVKGQKMVKRALEVSAAGGHNCLLIGSPRIWKNNDGKKTTNNITRFKF